MLTLTMIVRNCGDTVGRAIASALPHVDEVIVVLAGHSTDNTAKVVADTLAETKQHHIETFYPEDHPAAFFEDGGLSDFAAARNYALSFVPDGSHWMFLDGDDELMDAHLLAPCLKALDETAGVIACRYDYTHDEYGTALMVQRKERLYSGLVKFQWHDRVHEWAKAESPASYIEMGDAKPYVKHHRVGDEARTDRNLRILELMLEEDPTNRRARLHYAEGLFAAQQWEGALAEYNIVYQQPEIEAHAYHAACQAAKCAAQLDEQGMAGYWSLAAIDMRPQFKDGYLLRATVAADQEEWEKCLFWLDQASDKMENTPESAISVWMNDYKWNAWIPQYKALFHLKRFGEAAMVAQVALQEYPDSAHWLREFSVAREAERIERSVASIGQLVDHFVRRGDTLNAWKMLQDQNLPMTIRQDERILALRNRIFEAVKHVWDSGLYRKFYSNEVVGHEINGTSIDRFRLEPIIQSLKLRKAKRVLEVGSGAGGPAIWMLRQLPDVEEYVCLDINADLVELGNQAAKFHGVDDRLRFECADLSVYLNQHPEMRGQMGMPGTNPPYYDAVLLLEIIEHMAPQDAHNLVTWAEEIGFAVIGTTPGHFVGDIPPLYGAAAEFPRDHVKEWSLSDIEQMIFKVPRRRPVNIFKAVAPEVDEDWVHILPDGEKHEVLHFPNPGMAVWIFEFDNRSRHNSPVVIYTGAGPGWSPLDLDTKGLGGAETMAVRMAEQFARNNHPVILYGDWTGVRNGVIYRSFREFNPEKPYGGVDAWLFISSRIPWVFDDHINADIKWLWQHDIDSGPDEMTAERLEQIDRIILLSEWHKQHWMETFPDIPEDRYEVSRNGVDLADFPTKLPERIKHRFVWPSSADRGLDVLLEWWPEIRKMWDDAELHIFYGWETVDVAKKMPGYEWLEVFKYKITELCKQPGVVWRGRVTQPVLHEEMAKSQFWMYPSKNAIGNAWNETYCIAAVEAMTMGVQPIVADVGALPERLREFGLADGLVPLEAPRKAWLKALKAHDVMPNAAELVRRREVAASLSFDDLYEDWMRLVMETSLRDNANGHHNFAVVSQTA